MASTIPPRPRAPTTHTVAALSSFIYVVVALAVLRKSEARRDPMIVLSSLAIAVIGLGSVAFHGTMLLEWEMLDEVPMLLIICSLATAPESACVPLFPCHQDIPLRALTPPRTTLHGSPWA